MLARKKKAKEGTGNLFDVATVVAETDKIYLDRSCRSPEGIHQGSHPLRDFFTASVLTGDPPVTVSSANTRPPLQGFPEEA